MIAAAAIAFGVAAGLAAGGSVRELANFDVASFWPLAILYLVQGVARGRIAGSDSTSLGVLVWASVSIVLCVYIFAVVPRSLPGRHAPEGFVLFAMGTASNVVAVLLNQTMPVLHIRGTGRAVAESSGFYSHLNDGTLAPWLGDVLVLQVQGHVLLLSMGDVLIVVGVAMVLIEVMLRQPTSGPVAA